MARRETKAEGGLHHPSEPRQGGGPCLVRLRGERWGDPLNPECCGAHSLLEGNTEKAPPPPLPTLCSCLPEWRRRAWAADSDQQAHKLQAFRMPPPADLRAKYQKALGAPAKQLWIAAAFARSGGKQGCPIVSCSLAGGLATSGERGN